jgi:branched-chain amino acid transport system substrate-binding protein
MSRFWLSIVLSCGLWATGAIAADGPIRIGVLNDMSGAYADYQGPGSVVAAKLAVEDAGKVGGRIVEVVSADHQNKVDIGTAIARRWFDLDGVDMIVDVPNSAIAFGVSQIARDKNKVFIGSGAGSAELTGKQCSPNTVHWTYDTWQIGHTLGQAVVDQGGKRWFFITADYAFGKDLQSSTSDAVRAAGGEVLGSAVHPIGTSDFSSLLVQAQSSGADVLALANGGADTTNSIKQSVEFGLTKTMMLAGLVLNINMIQAVGLKDSQGSLAVMPFYWDMNDGTRSFAKRFAAAHPRHLMPNDMQAGVYAAVLHYLKAVAALGGDASDGLAIVDKMKALPTNDPLFGAGSIRKDGRVLHPVYLMKVKTPEESRGDWDFFKLVSTIEADKAFRPLDAGGCPLVAQGK